jgi:hypothetical protein
VTTKMNIPTRRESNPDIGPDTLKLSREAKSGDGCFSMEFLHGLLRRVSIRKPDPRGDEESNK